MAIACPNCGAQNPDGNAFCASCGRPLAAAPAAPAAAAGIPPGPPTAAPVPPGAPVYYPSPYYAPPPGALGAVPHKLPWPLIGGGVLALFGVLTLFAVLFLRHPERPTPVPPTQVAVVPTPPPPPPTTAPPPAIVPTTAPPPPATRAPTPPPTTPPNPPPGGSAAENDVVRVALPTGWTKDTQNSDAKNLIVDGPSPLRGSVAFFSGQLTQKATPQQLLQGDLASHQKNSPDAKFCGGPNDATIGGVQGIIAAICFTLTPQNGAAIKAAVFDFEGVNADGTIDYFVQIFNSDEALDDTAKAAQPILKSVQWKLR